MPLLRYYNAVISVALGCEDGRLMGPLSRL